MAARVVELARLHEAAWYWQIRLIAVNFVELWVDAAGRGKTSQYKPPFTPEAKITAEQRAEAQRVATEWQEAFEKRQAEK